MKRVLIIEDDRDIVELVRYNLANEGFQVSAAFDGGTGLSTLKKTPPDLLLLVWTFAGKCGKTIR
jgi:DNA-binding response OmpR family regulator